MAGRSTEPRLILTSIALAFPRVGLSVIAAMGSSSPSRARLTTKEIKSSGAEKSGSPRVSAKALVDVGAPVVGSSDSALTKWSGILFPLRFDWMSIALAIPRVGLSGMALIKSILPSSPA